MLPADDQNQFLSSFFSKIFSGRGGIVLGRSGGQVLGGTCLKIFEPFSEGAILLFLFTQFLSQDSRKG